MAKAGVGGRDSNETRGKTMFRKMLLSVAVTASLCSIGHASEIHRVVTTLDANNKSTTLADGQVTLNVSPSGNGSANLW